jgi:hypothetical protein
MEVNMIGLSLSLCIQDVIEGRVKYEQVERLVTGTKALTPAHFAGVLDSYAGSYWRKNPALAINLAWRLWAEGKIEQPRLSGDAPHAIYNSVGHWATDEAALAAHPKGW